jgi:hypothetical protein
MSLFRTLSSTLSSFSKEKYPIDNSPIVAPNLFSKTLISRSVLTKPSILSTNYSPPRYIPSVKSEPVVSKSLTTPTLTTKTIQFKVVDELESLPRPNVYVDGKHTTIGDDDGNVTLHNVSIGSTIKITYVGMKNYEAAANAIPATVVLESNPTELKEVVVTRPKKTTPLTKPEATKNNTFLWALGAIVLVGGIKYMSSNNKSVKAKI